MIAPIRRQPRTDRAARSRTRAPARSTPSPRAPGRIAYIVLRG